MYTEQEMKGLMQKGHTISNALDYANGKVVIQTGHTINYYIQNRDGTWDNCNCKTVY